MQKPKSAGAVGADFPYTDKTVCYIEVGEDGDVRWGRDECTYARALAGDIRLYAVWPGNWSSHLFAIDDLDQYARAFGIVHDPERSGLAEHEHQVSWRVSPYEENPSGSYIGIEVSLDCGCEIRDIRSFAKHMQEQRGWNIATTTGWGSSHKAGEQPTYSLRARRTSLD